jgi:hypothetical protein
MFNQDYEKRLLRQHSAHMACNSSSEASSLPLSDDFPGPSNVISPVMATPTMVSGAMS